MKQTKKIMQQTKKEIEKQQKFQEAVNPLMKYLAENHHPHNSVYVTSRTAELLEGQKCLNTNKIMENKLIYGYILGLLTSLVVMILVNLLK